MCKKQFILAGILSGIVIAILMFTLGAIVQLIFPYDVFSIGGMRPITDPLMMLFFLSPLIVGFAQTSLYFATKKAFAGKDKNKTIKLGLLMFLIYIVPSEFIILTTMTYPFGFHVENFFGSFIYLMAGAYVIVKILK
jgi:hypothetical protein